MFTRALLLGLVLIATTSCVHKNRISRGDVRRLTKNGESFVLVFGSLSTLPGKLPAPTIRFQHQTSRAAPEYLLKSLAISSGDRFYAVLQSPRDASYTLPYLDEFFIEVGSPSTGYDRIAYVRLRKAAAPVAMYVGEIQMSPPSKVTIQGQNVAVTVRDDFQNATQELKRLYPDFAGSIAKSIAVRTPVPTAPTPDRVH